MKYLIKLFVIQLFLLPCQLTQFACKPGSKPINILILSGRNNHDWQQTTPFIDKIFSKTGIFKTEITNQPDTLKFSDFEKFDVVLSNWNSWPENDLRWPTETENALIQFIKKGGGFVTFHSSTSALYNWPKFKEISTAAWIMDTTSHGKPSETLVEISNVEHPVIQGIKGFEIFDELWINAAKNNKFEVLGTATNEELIKNGKESQPAIMVSEYGKGRIFHTTLGHDIKAMESAVFQMLMLRGTAWAATGKVFQELPSEQN